MTSFGKKISSSQKGDATIMVLMAAALGAVLVLGLASSVVYMYRLQRTAALSVEQKDAIKQIDYTMSDFAACAEAFNGPGNGHIQPALVTPGTPVSNNLKLRLKLNGSDTITELDPSNPKEIIPGINLTGITFTRPVGSGELIVSAANNPVLAADYPAATRIYRGQLELATSKSNSELFAPAYKPVSLPITVATNNGGQIITCSTDGPLGKMCLASGSLWNPFARPEARCTPTGTCVYAGTYGEGADSEGGFVNPRTGARSCPAGFDPYIKGNVARGASCGKNCYTTRYTKVYECARCITDAGQLLTGADTAIPSSFQFDLGNEEAAIERGINSNRGYLNGLDHVIQ